MTSTERSTALAIVVAIAGSLSSRPAVAAGMTKDQCIEANAKGQDLRRDHSISLAREQLRLCADPSCPSLVRSDCIKRLDEADSAEPTIAFEIKDANGADVAATVTMDGKPLPAKLSGTALSLDPGPHTVIVEAPGLTPVTRSLVLVEGQKGRREAVVLVAPAAAVAPPVATSGAGLGGRRLLGVAVGGAGVIGLGIGGIFGALTLSEKSKQESACSTSSCAVAAHTQAQSDHSAGITDATVSTIGFVAGAALVAGGIALFFTSPPPDATSPTALRFVPSVGRTGGGLTLYRAF